MKFFQLAGKYVAADGGIREVAVKVCNNENKECNESFVREAQIMMNLNHPCIVQFIGLKKNYKTFFSFSYIYISPFSTSGLSSGPPLMMVLELVRLGSLLEFMTSQPGSVSEHQEVPLWVSTIKWILILLQTNQFPFLLIGITNCSRNDLLGREGVNCSISWDFTTLTLIGLIFLIGS